MIILKNKIIHLVAILFAIILIDFIYSDFAESANNTRIIIDENLRPGMTLKEAIQLLGPPESINMSNAGTMLIPYDSLGLSIEVASDGTRIEGIHLQSSFKGRFASGLTIGADFQEILSAYDQPDIMTKEIIEYSDTARKFHIRDGKLTGADIYSAKSVIHHQTSVKETGRHEEIKPAETRGPEIGEKKQRYEEVRKEEPRYVERRYELIRFDDLPVFDLFGIKLKNTLKGLIIAEIKPGSPADEGGLKSGERVRKASIKRYGVRNIYTASGLEKILRDSIRYGEETVNILQEENRFYTIKVPEVK